MGAEACAGGEICRACSSLAVHATNHLTPGGTVKLGRKDGWGMKKKATYTIIGVGVVALLTGYNFQNDVNLEITVRGDIEQIICIANNDERDVAISSVIVNKRKTVECEFISIKSDDSDGVGILPIDYAASFTNNSYKISPLTIQYGYNICVRTFMRCGKVLHVGINTDMGNYDYEITYSDIGDS